MKDYSILTDTPELEIGILEDRVVSTILKYSELFCFIHFSDSNSNFPAWKKTLRFKFNLPPQNDMAELRKLIEMAIYLVDRVVFLSENLSNAVLTRNKELRAKVARKKQKLDHETRQEQFARKKEEQRAKELEARAKMTPEQLQRLDEKERKERAKKAGPKMKVMR